MSWFKRSGLRRKTVTLTLSLLVLSSLVGVTARDVRANPRGNRGRGRIIVPMPKHHEGRPSGSLSQVAGLTIACT